MIDLISVSDDHLDAKAFRIVMQGGKYIIEKLVEDRFLFFSWSTWELVWDFGSYRSGGIVFPAGGPAQFDCESDANFVMEKLIKKSEERSNHDPGRQVLREVRL